ncbi:acetylxylan esterase [Halogeometricum sp. S1BR25-6]|uniref:Acetylxylan esterase n=1 Tax=Halogeometricum salsisoli TaxID=2950536 RepID=A0ABU2GJX3_9EURY|nr:alpha/beta fold hydrolase [Halogeometricum sp. S1BR25-6]MDS0300589.1 acetylxylan esterase [Halogeometricum sp. S1BR25-6]
MGDDGFDYDGWFDGVLRNTERRYAYDGETGAAFEAWQASFREELRGVLGFPAIREVGVPDIGPERREGATEDDGYERQTWTVTTERGFRVPFHLLLPASTEPPYPVVLTLHGHTKHGKDLATGVADGETARRGIVEERRDIARQAAERGYAALAPDLRAFGELARRPPGEASESGGDGRPCTRWRKRAHLVGRTLVGERVWDALRLLEFIERHPPLDANRLAVCGHSGGGTVALLAAALDERIGAAVVCASVCPFEDALVPIDHCPCNYTPGVRRLGEVWDFAGLVAPRPLSIVAGDEDALFPVAGTRRAYDRVEEIYRGAEAGDACRLFVGEGGHRFYEAGAWPFVSEHL